MPEAWETIDAAYQVVGRDLFGRDDLRTALLQRPPDESAFFTLVLVGGEIDNGGFSQLFTNSTGELVANAIAAAERFGLAEHAHLLREASDRLFPDGVPVGHEDRLAQWKLLDADADEAIDGLDRRWWALNDVLEDRLHSYARNHHSLP